MDARKAFGIRLKEIRTSRGFSQEKLAASVGRSVDALSKLERGVSFPGLETVMSLSRELGIPMAQLLEPFETAPPTSQKRAALQSQLLAVCHELSDDQLAIAVRQVRALIGRDNDAR